MTATVEDTQTQSGTGSTGRIARVIGPVVDIEFPADSMPEMYNLLETQLTILCLLYTSPSPRDGLLSRMPSSA